MQAPVSHSFLCSMHTTFCFTALAALIALAGCDDDGGDGADGGAGGAGGGIGDSSVGPDGGGGGASLDEIVRFLARLDCEHWRRCPQSEGDEAVFAILAAASDCPAAMEAFYRSEIVSETDGEIPVEIDPTAVAACERQVFEACIPPDETSLCSAVFVGRTRVGEPCTEQTPCERGAWCDATEESDFRCGTCMPLALLAPGEACESDDECLPAEGGIGYCDYPDPESETGVCRQLTLRTGAAIGEPCGLLDATDEYAGCAEGTYCHRDANEFGEPGERGVCAARVALGETCDDVLSACVAGAVCDGAGAADDTCVTFEIAGLGQPCEQRGMPFCNFFDGLLCVDGTCVASDGSPGSACGVAFLGCDAMSWCDFGGDDEIGRCNATLADGDPCDFDGMCQSDHCADEGTCGPSPAEMQCPADE
jgi:hypothetical protein